MRHGLVENGLLLVASVPQNLLYKNLVSTTTGLLLLRKDRTDPQRKIAFVNFAQLDSLPENGYWESIIAGDEGSETRQSAAVVAVDGLGDDYRLDPQYFDPAYLQIRAPRGYVEMALGEIAEIRGGVSIDRRHRLEERPEKLSRPYLQVRHILDNGEITESIWVTRKPTAGDERGWAKPGDLLVTIAGTVGKVAIVSTTN